MKIALNFGRAAVLALSLLAFAAPGRLHGQSVVSATSASTMEFSYQQGASIPNPQRLAVYSTPGNLPFTATVTPSTPWLLVNGALNTTTGTTGGNNPFIQVQPVPNSLAPGNYTANLQVTVQGAPAPINVAVNLTVSAAPVLMAQPSDLLAMTVQAGSRISTPVSVTSSTPATPVSFTATASMISGAGWLSVTSNTTATPATLVVTADATALQPGTYTGTILLTTGANAKVTIPVALTVPAGPAAPQLQISPASANFAYQPGFQSPLPRALNITSSTEAQFQYVAVVSGNNFVALSTNSNGSGATQTVSQNTGVPLYLVVTPPQTPGTYTANVAITPLSTGSTAVNVPVTLVVANSPLLTSSPDSVSFNYQLGNATPAAQTVTVQSTSGALPFSVAATTSGTSGDWLTVTQTGVTTPGNISIGVNQTRLLQLAAGQYQGGIVVTAAGAQNSPYTIPVTLTVSGSAFLVLDPTSLDFGSVQPNGQAPDIRSFLVRSTDNTSQTFKVTTDTPWISLPTGGIPQQTGTSGIAVNVGVSPSALPTAGGRVEGAIVVTPIVAAGTTAPAQRVPVFVTVAAPNTLTATPNKLTFTQAGTTQPASQQVQITTALLGASYTARTDKSWLTVTPTFGSPNNATLTVSVNAAGLPVGETQTANVIVTVPGATDLRIPVTFTVQSGATLTPAPATLSFSAQTAGPAPANQTIGLTSNGAAVDFTASATTTSGGNWLSVTPTSGKTGASGAPATNLTVSVTAAGLPVGTYTGKIAVASAGTPTVEIPVTMTVAVAATPLPRTVENAATNVAGAVSPGEIVAIKGSNLGPATGVGGHLTSGFLATDAGEVRVYFDNVPAPVLYARQDQVNVVAPYEITGRLSTKIVVEYRGVRSEPLEQRVAETAPGIFTLDATGRGNGAILNADYGVNGVNNPAARGSVITIYATGEGQTSPATTGKVITDINDLRRPQAPVTVRIGGQTAQVLYAGSAGGFVSGAFQINVLVPTGLTLTQPTMAFPVEVQVGAVTSPAGVTVAVK